MEGVGSRLGRASARYGPTQTVFNGPVRKWKKKWVHISSSSSSSASALSQSNGTGNGSPLVLCKWTPLSSSPSSAADVNGGGTPEEPPPKRRFRYTPVSSCLHSVCGGLILRFVYVSRVFLGF